MTVRKSPKPTVSSPECMLHEQFMALALRLAEKGRGKTSPNPMVGAVLVKNGKILATGYHHRHGADHAEVDCLKKMKMKAPKGSVLYVTLEPCCHTGLTPPCTDAILKSGVSHVVVAMRDPNPIVSGKGIRRLKRAGIRITEKILMDDAMRLNAAYITWRTQNRPLVILKAGMSLDGKIAMRDGTSKWITGLPARVEAHRLRREVDAILVGAQTVVFDNPMLTVRHVPLRRVTQPKTVVLDPTLRVPIDAAIFSGGNAIVVCSDVALRTRKAAELKQRGMTLLAFPLAKSGQLPLRRVLKALASHQILSVMIEGGASTYSQFMAADLVDHLVLFVAPCVMGRNGISLFEIFETRSLSEAPRFKREALRPCGEDVVLYMSREKGLR